MPSRKLKNRKPAGELDRPSGQPSMSQDTLNRSSEAGFFPLARYISVAGVHIVLLLFASIVVPRASSLSAAPQSLSQLPSILGGLTNNPTLGLAWLCVGIIPLQGWWAGWIKKWSFEFSMHGTDAEKRERRNEQSTDKIPVSFVRVLSVWVLG